MSKWLYRNDEMAFLYEKGVVLPLNEFSKPGHREPFSNPSTYVRLSAPQP
jgi:hypothetical protein